MHTNQPQPWEAGDVVLERFQVKGLIGKGGMGRVYRVFDPEWGTEAAMKQPSNFAFTELSSDGFLRECETWLRLRPSPYIASCFFTKMIDGVPHIFAEYVEGGTLADWINRKHLYAGDRREALLRVLRLAAQIGLGLKSAHDDGVIHQDVKPSNVLISTTATAKIVDFGLTNAKRICGPLAIADADRTLIATVGGLTREYSSPEQWLTVVHARAAARARIDRRTDIYSWAVTVLEMFIGTRTWESVGW